MARSIATFLICSFTAIGTMLPASAHHPDRECEPVRPRVDVIGPVGRNLAPSYRRQFNRPSYLVGKIVHTIAPTSQEAIAWHKADHQGLYAQQACRQVPHHFYRKPWEALQVGPRRNRTPSESQGLRPIAAGESLPLVPTGEALDDDPMAFADNEGQNRDQSTSDVEEKDDNESSENIIDTPADDFQLLPEPPESPSDRILDDEIELRKPAMEDAVEEIQTPQDAIGSGLDKIKRRLRINGPSNQ